MDKIVLMNLGNYYGSSISRPGPQDGVPRQGFTRRAFTLDVHQGIGVRVTLDHLPYGRTRIQAIDFNPSRIAYPDPADGNVNPSELPKVLRVVAGGVGRGLRTHGSGKQSLDIDPFGEHVRVVRLDLARDFVLPPEILVDPLLVALKRVPRPYKPPVGLVGTGPAIQTLETRRSEYSVLLYDQVARHGGRMLPTSLRFEAQLHGQMLGKFGLRRPHTIESDRCVEAVRWFWEWMRMGSPVASGDRLTERLRRKGLSGKDLGNVLGYVLAREQGFAHEYDPKHRKKLEGILEAAGAAGVIPGSATEGYLDLDAGRFIPVTRPRRRVIRRPKR